MSSHAGRSALFPESHCSSKAEPDEDRGTEGPKNLKRFIRTHLRLLSSSGSALDADVDYTSRCGGPNKRGGRTARGFLKQERDARTQLPHGWLMANVSDPRLQAKYLDVRQKLTELSYGGSFGVEYVYNVLTACPFSCRF